jgi:transcriptional regulator with XRE-family HTH domain
MNRLFPVMESGLPVDTHLTDLPIEPARMVPADGILPAQVARSLGTDEEVLTRALKTLGHERVGEVDAVARPNPYRGPLGMAALPNAQHLMPIDLRGDSTRRPRIVAMRFNGERLMKARLELRLSQTEFATAVREAGARLGAPNSCTKRNVQKWEGGQTTMPQFSCQRALEEVTGLPFTVLCTPFLPPDPDEALAELSSIVTGLNETITRIVRFEQAVSAFAPVVSDLGEVARRFVRLQSYLAR